jgi:hypothetical protein
MGKHRNAPREKTPAPFSFFPDGDADGLTPSAPESRERVYVDMDTFEATF